MTADPKPEFEDSVDAAKAFTISRMFDAPRASVWAAWTQREAMAQWWGPRGCPLEAAVLDLRPSGMFHYAMGMRDSSRMWGRFVYREIAEPERLVFVNSFSDEQGGVTRAPFSPSWPLEILNVLTLTEQGGKTMLMLQGRPVDPTADESATFEGMFASMQQGFGGTLDQLETYLSRG